MEEIRFNSERDKWGGFSNFARFPIEINAETWATTEHYFPAMKFEGTKFEAKIRNLSSPGAAAKYGRDKKLPLRKDWEKFYNFYRPHGGLRGKTPYEILKQKLTS